MQQSTKLGMNGKNREGSKYAQVRRHLQHQMQTGEYEPDQSLPGERGLASSLGVAVSTIRQALQELESDGFIRRIQGKGTFVNSPAGRRKHVTSDTFSVITFGGLHRTGALAQ